MIIQQLVILEELNKKLIHSGYAIEVLTEEAAKESLNAWNELLEELENE